MAPSSDQFLEWATAEVDALELRLAQTYAAINRTRDRLDGSGKPPQPPGGVGIPDIPSLPGIG